MAHEAKSTILGMVAGIFTKILTGDVITAVFTAFMTGAAAYLGQVIIKEIHLFIKRKI